MKKFISILSLMGIGALIYTTMDIKRKRRRLLEETPYNKVARDFGGTVPGPLFKYLKNLGSTDRTNGGYELWGYQRILEVSRSVAKEDEDDILMILGTEKSLTEELGKKVCLLYSKNRFPDTLILVTYNDQTGELDYHKEVGFDPIS